MESDISLERLAEGKRILDAFRPLPPSVVAELRHRFEVRLTYHSTAIEGNTLTQSETPHLRFVTTHPFRDGNGRVGRLLMNLMLLRAGYPIAVIPVTERTKYIDALVAAQQGEGRSSLDRLVRAAVENSLRDMLEASLGSDEALLEHERPADAAREWLGR